MQAVEGGLQWRRVPPGVERTADLRGVRVDVDGALEIVAEAVDVQHDAGGPVGVAGEDQRVERALGVGRERGGDLLVDSGRAGPACGPTSSSSA